VVVVPIEQVGSTMPRDATPGASYAAEVADALRAQWLLLQTPADVTPGKSQSRKAERGRRQARVGQAQVGLGTPWPWSADQAERFAAELGAVLVATLRIRAGRRTRVYTRLRAFASGGRLRASAIERAAERLTQRNEALVVLEGRGGARGAQLLRELLAAGDEANEAAFASGGYVAGDDGSREDDEEEAATMKTSQRKTPDDPGQGCGHRQ